MRTASAYFRQARPVVATQMSKVTLRPDCVKLIGKELKPETLGLTEFF